VEQILADDITASLQDFYATKSFLELHEMIKNDAKHLRVIRDVLSEDSYQEILIQFINIDKMEA